MLGGFIGIALPLIPQLGLGVLAALMVSWTVFVLIKRPGRTGPGTSTGEPAPA